MNKIVNVFTKSIVLHWLSLEAEIITCFIHWVLISYYYIIPWRKCRTGRSLYLLFKDVVISCLSSNKETNNSETSCPHVSPMVTSWINLPDSNFLYVQAIYWKISVLFFHCVFRKDRCMNFASLFNHGKCNTLLRYRSLFQNLHTVVMQKNNFNCCIKYLCDESAHCLVCISVYLLCTEEKYCKLFSCF